MFVSHDVWDGDNGSTVTRAGFLHQTVYRFDGRAERVALPMEGACCLWGFAPSPTGDAVAFGTYGADPPVTDAQKAVTGVRVVRPDDSPIAWFPGSHSPCWSRDGKRLAMIESRAESNGVRVPTAIRIMDLRGKSVTHPFQPQRIAWGNGDTLFLESEEYVDALDVARGKAWRTTHAGCEVSPDGAFSFRYRGQFMPFRVKRQAGGVELGGCMLSELGIDATEPRVLSPFWIRTEKRGHLLCFSIVTVESGTIVKQPNGQIAIIDPGVSPPGQEGVRTIVFDPQTFETLVDLPGKVVAPTNDHRSLVMLLGDTLSRVGLPAWVPEVPRPQLARLRVQVQEWGGWGLSAPSARLLMDSTLTVAAGDWLPSGPWNWCRDQIRVAGLNADSRLELHLPAGRFHGYVESNAGPRTTRLLLGDRPVRLRTNSVDGGYDVVVSRVP